MALEAWWPRYLEIVARFGYSIEEDQRAADLLSDILDGQTIRLSCISNLVTDKNVLIFGAGPSLPRNLEEIIKNNIAQGATLISADGATTALLEQDLQPDLVVTDLDGTVPDILQAHQDGSIVLVHAHGDNTSSLEHYVPILLHDQVEGNGVLGSTQARPRPGVINTGGFTDGDRCVFLAEAFRANIIGLVGMDLGVFVGRYSKPNLSADILASKTKREKLSVAKTLLEWLASLSQCKIINLTGGTTQIPGIPDQDITEFAWEAQ
ncbi:MAG: 6-hydroxymethylpterin diphosphokinase MptE-like protein [Promethearchaeota archaeon]